MIKEKVFVNNDNKVRFVCPECGETVVMDVSEYKTINKAVIIEHWCECGSRRTMFLERRKFHRKQVNIPGTYTLKGEVAKRPMTVKDLSRAGLRFESGEKRDLKIGDRLTAEFRLNNIMIKKEICVKMISGHEIGSEYCSRDSESVIDRAYDMAITHYILYARLI